ncbi:MAG: Type 1 glutamine amidotransferase-like domain-containing protein [bacterium]
MKLLLTSSGIGVKNELLKFIPKPYANTRVAYIITASRVEEDTSYLDKESKLLRDIGCQVEEMTFENCDQNSARKLLHDIDLIYVQGGNSFYLLKILKESGADVVIKEMVKKGVPYIGVSAGSYIACPTIEVATWSHQDKNSCGLKDLSALAFVPFLISAHYTDEYKEILKQEIAKTNYEVKVLRDDQALLVEDHNIKLVKDTIPICGGEH